VRQAVEVLAVDGRLDMSDPTESESFFFVHTLDPDLDGSEGTKVEVIPPEAMGDTPLENYDLVVLLNVAELPVMLDANGEAVYPRLEALKDYVRGGGGLVIFTGDRINTTFYNGPFYANGSGLSPLRVGPRKGDPDKQETFFRLDPKSITAEGVLRIFSGFLAAGQDPTRFIRFYAFSSTNPITPPPASPDVKPPRVLARFGDEDNSAAIVSRQFGKGMVLTFYFPATTRWTDWPADENYTYLVVMNDMMTYLAKPQKSGLSARVGEPIVYELPRGLRDAAATLKTPRHPEQPVVPLVPVKKPARVGAPQQLLRYERANSAGRYSLELALPDGTARHAIYARTVDPLEGDLACGREPALAAALGSEEFVYMDRTSAHPGRVAEAEPHKEYWMWALAIMAVLLAAETFLGQRFGHYAAQGKSSEKSK
jgi:hypothetical protein